MHPSQLHPWDSNSLQRLCSAVKPQQPPQCDATSTQNSLELFCTCLRNSILFHLTAASPSKRCKMHSQNKTFSKREQCCKNSISLASLCIGCSEHCACVIVTSHKSKVKDHKAHKTLHCAEHPTKHHRLEHLLSATE